MPLKDPQYILPHREWEFTRPAPIKMKANFFDDGSPYLNHPLLTRERTAQEIDFVLSKIHLPPGGRVLDVGCGPGRHSIELVQRGYRVVGIDPSRAMIEAAQARAAEAGASPDFRQAHGENFVSQDKFEAAICLFTSLGQINDDQDNRQLIQRVARVLRPGGGFVVEVPQRQWVADNLKSDDRFGEGDHFTEVRREFDASENIVTEIFKIVSPEKTDTYTLRYRVYDQGELEQLLEQAGFNMIATYGGYEDISLRAEDPIMVMVARKRG